MAESGPEEMSRSSAHPPTDCHDDRLKRDIRDLLDASDQGYTRGS
jgi:hypothetical protein